MGGGLIKETKGEETGKQQQQQPQKNAQQLR
jgi:hypothetical protein